MADVELQIALHKFFLNNIIIFDFWVYLSENETRMSESGQYFIDTEVCRLVSTDQNVMTR